jgi:DNA primase
MALPPAFLDELRARTPLHALIGRKTRLARNGRNWKGCCPFHNEKTPSFYVYEDHFHCFGCAAHGDAISFLMRAEGASFPEAVERLAGEAGLEVPKATPQQAAREARARDLHGVLAATAAAFERRLRLPEGRAGLDYLRYRGLSEATIASFGLGWSGEGRGALAAELKAQGIETAQLVAAGLMKYREPDDPGSGTVDLFYGRVMFPIRDRRGRVISFGGRILGDGQPKYLNGPETELFRKRQALYGLDGAREGCFRGAACLVVEGYMDVIALHQAGFAGAVAPLGTALTAEQLELIWRLSPEPVLCFDGDTAGQRAAVRAVELALPMISAERSLRIALMSGGEDPDTLIAKGGAPAFQAVLDAARPLSEMLYDLLTAGLPATTPEQRAVLRRRLEEAAGRIPDKVLAGEYRRALLDRFFARRGGRPQATPRLTRPPIDETQVRRERARNLLAILLQHPGVLPDVEECLADIDLPEGAPADLRAALLAWLSVAPRLDSADLARHLENDGLRDAVTWALRPAGLVPAALREALPREVLDGWWHFFGLLRGEAALLRDRAEAERQLIETNDPSAQQRLIRLSEAIVELREGGWGAGAEASGTQQHR